MRLVIKKDKKITQEEMDTLEQQFVDLYYENAGLSPTFYIEETDYTTYPTYIDSDNDIRPTSSFLKGIASEVYGRYGEWGTDHIIVLVHEDNWQSDTDYTKGIWGTSYSNIWHTYHVQYVRFDRDNPANSLGTLYHEVMHSHDNLIKTTLNTDVHKLMGLDWDEACVHGKHKDYSYIRYKENLDALQYVAPLLRESYAKRKALHRKDHSTEYAIIELISAFLIKFRAVYNKKDGIPRT